MQSGMATDAPSVLDNIPFLNPECHEQVAIEGPHVCVTFAQLASDTAVLQKALASVSCVALSLPYGVAQIVALCGAVASRVVFVPVDETQSMERIEWILREAGVQGLLCDESSSSLLGHLRATRMPTLSITSLSIHRMCLATWSSSPLPPALLMHPDAMYVLFTSGSSRGTPSGVVGSYRATSNRLAWMWRVFPFTAHEKVLRSTKLTFVDALWEILGTLWHLVPLVLVPSSPVDSFQPPLVVAFDATIAAIERFRVTRVTVVPSLLQLLLQSHAPLSCIRYVLVSGETFHGQLLVRAMRWAPTTTFVNLFGSTEVSGDVTAHVASLADMTLAVEAAYLADGVPIGTMIVDNTTIKLMQGHDQVNDVGELWVAGSALALGYLESANTRSSAFQEQRGQRWFRTGDECAWRGGALMFRGRHDSQVKISGVAVHLDAIEAQVQMWLATHKELKRPWYVGVVAVSSTQHWLQLDTLVIVVGCEDDGSSTALSENDTACMMTSLHASHIYAQVSTRVLCLATDDFPFTSSGKVDRVRLKALVSRPRDILQSDDTLTAILAKHIDVTHMDDSKTLVEMGANSLVATMVLHALRRQCGLVLELTDVHKLSIAALRGHVQSSKRALSPLRSSSPTTSSKRIKPTRDNTSMRLYIAWQVAVQKCIDATPLIVRRPDTADPWIVVGSHDHYVICVDGAKPESVVWRTELPDRVESSCARHDESVFVGCYDGGIYSLALSTGEIQWVFMTHDQVKCSPLVVPARSVVVCGSHDHHLYGLDVASGDCVFEIPFQGSIFSTPAYDPSRALLFCASTAGELQAHAWPSHPPSTTPTWVHKLKAPVFSNLVVIGPVLLVGCADGCLYSFSLDGAEIWHIPTAKPIFSTPCVVDTWVVFGSHDGILRCALLATGALVASVTLGHDAIFASPTIVASAPPLVGACTTDGVLHLWNPLETTCRASLALGGAVFSSPVALDDTIYVGTRANALLCVRGWR
ncbi:Aste57867_13375 [Aphanomyces stellatus]|uniref:Aste57867_13375 protein n=1 Tax=Aphanomyces stellatus TaxID=120398 RepID=A0A485KYG6_9STRA|nr:hypothetical protein As57867_013325 [Aphanomyces stellatus]VFT90214.1 Aste57867_13375 [Aphanomyces stellatus]